MCQGPAVAVEAKPTAADSNGKSKEGCRNSDPQLVAGKEVVGRKIALWDDKLMDWPEAAIAQFDVDSGKHLVRFLERSEGNVKHEERWIDLAKNRFQWLSDAAANAAPNPTYAAAPKGEDAVGYRVRVFWPGMARWYQGKIEAYNPDTKRHTVKYRDGDIQKLLLRHEAVSFQDKVGTSARPRSANGKETRVVSGSKRIRDGKNGRGSKKETTPAPNTVTPPKKRKANGMANGRVESTSTSDGDERSIEASSDEDNGLSSDEDDGNAVENSEASGEDSDFEAQRGKAKRRNVGGSGKPRKPTKGSGVGARKNGLVSKAAAAAAAAATAQTSQPAPRRRGRPPGSGSGRRAGGKARSGLMRKDSGGFRAGRGPMRFSRNEEEVLRGAGSEVVGARVAIFWNEDEAFYKVSRNYSSACRAALMVAKKRNVVPQDPPLFAY